MVTKAYIYYISVTIKIQIQSLENTFIKRNSHELRTRLVSLFKIIQEYPDKKKKKKKKSLHVVRHRPVEVLYIRLSIIVK
jgi:hypothetical protein